MTSAGKWILLFLIACTLPIFAQITRPTADQAPPVPGIGQRHVGALNETVNPATGAVSIRIDAGVPPARGITVPFAFGYDSNAAQHVVGGLGVTDNSSYLGQGGWSYVVPMLSEIQSTFSVTNHSILGSINPVDPVVFVPCEISDPNCFVPAGSNGPGCTPFFCPPTSPGQTTTTPTTCTFYDHFNFFDMSGNVHDLGIISQNATSDCVSVAGAPVTALTGRDNVVVAQATTPNAVPSTTLVDSDGTYYSFPSSTTLPNNQQQARVHNRVGDNLNLRPYVQLDMLPSFVEDRNGNIAVFTDHGSGSFDVTDTLGRIAISTTGFGTSGNTVRIAGLANPYTVNWTPLSANWPMNVQIIAPSIPPTVPRTSCSASPGPAVYNVSGQVVPLQGITELQMPNGRSYRFQYDPVYGLINKMIYPGGGYVRFVWGVNAMSSRELVPSTEPLASPGVPFPCEIIYDTPAVIQRFVSFDGQTEVEEQDFSYSTTWAPVHSTVDTGMQEWTSKQTTVSTKDLATGTSFKTVYTYVPKPNGARPSKIEGQAGMVPTSPVEQTVQDLDSNGHVLRTVNKDYHYGALFPAADETVILDNGQTSKIHRCFAFADCSGQLPPTGQVLGALLTDSFEYGYGLGAPGPLLRRTHIDYSMFKSPLFPDVYANTFGNPSTYLGVPQANTVYDGNGTRMEETDYVYDGSSISGADASSHDETNYGAKASVTRANPTSVTRKCFNVTTATTCPDAVNTFIYDETGQVVSKKDPLGNVTSFSYQDNFSDAAPAKNSNAYLTKITLPETNAVAHTQTFSYAYSDGQLTSSTDQNLQKTSYLYDDPLRRLTETDMPDGGQTKVAYNDVGPNPNVVTTKTITASISSVSTSVMDGMGHTIQTQLNSDPLGADFVDTVLDGLGRPIRVSNPHRSTPLPTDGVTSTQYDALGRVTQITKQDGSVSSIVYSGSCYVTTDEVGSRRRGCHDGLGRIIEVDEPTPGVSEAISATNATATVTISGTLQSKQSQAHATGTVMINGTDSLVPGTNAYDFGTVTVSVGGGSVTVSYGNSGASASSGSSIAAALCSAISSTSSTSALVTCSNNGTVMNLTALAAASGGNGIVLGINAQTSLPQSTKSAFSASTTSGTLSGGGALLYDSSSSMIAVAGYSDTANWSGSGTTPASIALSLSAAINNDSGAYVTASASGSTVTLVSKIPGLGGNLSITCSSGYDSTNFATPSFGISCPSALNGGREAGSLSVPMLTLYNYDALGNLLQVTQQGGTTDQTQWRLRTFNYDSLSRLVTATNPESGTINYSFDVDSNVLQQVSPQPNQTGAATQTVSYCYDPLNRITGKAYSPTSCTNGQFATGTAAISYQYDQGVNAIGKLSSLTDQAGSANYSYDSMGRISAEKRTITGVTKGMSYTYNLDGSIATATYPSGAVITYTPDPDGRVGMVQDLGNNINYVAGPSGLGTSATYAPDGSLTGFLSGATTSFPGITNTFSFNNRLQPVNVAALSTGPNATAIVSISGMPQSITSGATNPKPGTGNITITGSERSVTTGGTRYCGAFDTRGRCVDWEVSPITSTADSGTVTITVNGHADSTSYQSGSDTTTVASGLATAINKDANAFVNATASSGVLSLSARQTGETTNYSWKLSSSSSDSADFGAAGSFSSNPTSGALTGGSNGDPGTTVYDSGSVSITLGSFQATVPFGPTTNASASAVASALGAAINVPASPASASVTDATLKLQLKTTGSPATAVGALATTHDQPAVFANPSFTSPATTFSGGVKVTLFSLNYDFHLGNGDNGNVRGITNNKDTSRGQTFTYDALNRLTSAQNAGTDCTATVLGGRNKFWGNSYSYDPWGNLLSKSVTKCSSEGLLVTADTLNRIHTGAPDYLYDAAGNMTFNAAPPTQTYTYDQENRLTGAAGYTYTYDGDGNRVRKSNGSLPADGTLYWYMTPGVVAESDLAGTLKSEYVFLNGERIARKDFPSNTIAFYFSDHLKTAAVITDATGTVKSESDYYPWGGELQFVNNDSNDYKFTGKKRDSETGLDYFGLRYYGSRVSRFISHDSIASDWEVGNPQTWNRYAYAHNSPLVYIDPDGAAVELLGDKKQREKELDTFKQSVGNKNAASRLYINEVKEGSNTRYFVGIKGNIGKFMMLSETAHDLANAVQDNQVVEFGLTDRNLAYYGGAVTYEKGEDHGKNQNVRVLVNPDQMDIADTNLGRTILGRTKFAGQMGTPQWRIRTMTTGIATWHEMGHAWGMIHGRLNGQSNLEANAWENRMRQQVYGPLGPENAKRISH